MGRRAVPQPSVQLRLILELLPALARHHHESAFQVRQGGHVALELFELGYWEDVFLPVTLLFFYIFEGDVGGHARCELPNCASHPFLVSQVGPA